MTTNLAITDFPEPTLPSIKKLMIELGTSQPSFPPPTFNNGLVSTINLSPHQISLLEQPLKLLPYDCMLPLQLF